MIETVSLRASKFRIAGLAVAAVIALGAGQSVRADMLQYTYTVPSATTPYSQTFGLNLFNSSLGTLTGVNISLSTSVVGEIDVYNFTGLNQSFANAMSSVPTSVSGPGPVTVNATASATLASGSVNSGTPYGYASFTGITATASSNTNVDSSNFGLYESNGNAVLASGLTATSGTGIYSGQASPGVAFTGSAMAAESIVVTYTFSPSVSVPVPASLVLLGTGLIPALGAMVRRRKPVA